MITLKMIYDTAVTGDGCQEQAAAAGGRAGHPQ